MAHKILLENRFTTHQKFHITGAIGAPFIIIIFSLVRMNLNYLGYLLLVAFSVIYFLMVCLAFTKRGLLKKGDDLYRCLYFSNKLILKKKISLIDKPTVSMLKFKRSQKMAWFSIARPDLASEFNAFDITLLNEKHTKKEQLISLSTPETAKKTIDFLKDNFNLKYEVYSPNFY